MLFSIVNKVPVIGALVSSRNEVTDSVVVVEVEAVAAAVATTEAAAA